VTGRDPREDYERERERLIDRDRVIEDRGRAENQPQASVEPPEDRVR
jgi:hypothetical protein